MNLKSGDLEPEAKRRKTFAHAAMKVFFRSLMRTSQILYHRSSLKSVHEFMKSDAIVFV